MSVSNEYVILDEESSYGGGPPASPVVGTNRFVIPLIDSNSFSMSEDPVFSDIPFGGGLDVVGETVADQREVKGSLSTLGYPALTAFLLNAAVTRINSAQTAPWTTTEPPNDLVSMFAWHVFRGRDGVWTTKGYPGTKILGVNLSVSRADPKLKLKCDLQAMKELPNPVDSSTLPTAPTAPTDASYPRGPYLMSHLTGNVTLGGLTVTQFMDLTIQITNSMDAQWYEGKWLGTNGCHGRKATADMTFLLKSTTDLRTTYLNGTARDFKAVFNNGTNSQTIDMKSNNYLSKLPYDFPLGKEFTQKATVTSRYDTTAGTDILVSNT